MLNRILFLFTTTLALALALLVFLSPYQINDSAPDWLRLFAEDLVIRRTAVVCAIGLFVTAMVFFRSRSPKAPPTDTDETPGRRPRTRNTVGA
jgi:hypothetical protein